MGKNLLLGGLLLVSSVFAVPVVHRNVWQSLSGLESVQVSENIDTAVVVDIAQLNQESGELSEWSDYADAHLQKYAESYCNTC